MIASCLSESQSFNPTVANLLLRLEADNNSVMIGSVSLKKYVLILHCKANGALQCLLLWIDKNKIL